MDSIIYPFLTLQSCQWYCKLLKVLIVFSLRSNTHNTFCSSGDPIYPVENTSDRNVNGNKMTCKRIAHPTDAQVNELMDRYVNALERLFEQYKVEAGYPNDTLVVT